MSLTSTLRLAGVIKESIVDGPGIRFVVFAQGCPHHCLGCHNAQTWSFDGGVDTSIQAILDTMEQNPLLTGITLSGGEPFCQSQEMADLAFAARSRGYHVMTYTGYVTEYLLKQAKRDQGIAQLMEHSDLLVDGPFVQALKGYDLGFRGSSNQRFVDPQASLSSGKVILCDG